MLRTKKFSKNLLTLSILTALTSGLVHAQEEKAEQKSDEEVIEVRGIRSAQKQALFDKRNAGSIMDSIAAEDIGKFPDQNISESLQRIPGITIARNGGEGQFITVRGMGPEHNAVLLNNRVLATENDGREFSFDVIAAELISGVDVHKAPTASLQEGGIGSTVNMKTARPLDLNGFQAVASTKAQHDENTGDTTPAFSGLISNTFLDDTFGLLASFNYSKRNFRTDRHYTDGYEARNPDDFTGISEEEREKLRENADENGNVHFQSYYTNDIDESTRERIGGTIAAQWQARDNLLFTIDTVYSRLDVDSDTSGIAWWAPADAVRSIDVDENGTVTDYVLEAGSRPTELTRYSRPRFAETKQFGFNAEWDVTDQFSAVFDASWSRATDTIAGDQSYFVGRLDNPGELTFSKRPGDRLPTYSNIGDMDMSRIRPGDTILEGRNIVDTAQQVTIDTKYELDSDSIVSSILTGASFHSRKKERDVFKTNPELTCMLCSSEGFMPEGVWGGSIDGIMDWVLSDDALSGITDPDTLRRVQEALAANGGTLAPEHLAGESGDVKEETFGAYVQVNLEGEIGDLPFSGNFGMRYLETDVTATGNDVIILDLIPDEDGQQYIPILSDPTEITEEGNYSRWLPSANFKLDLSDDVDLRAGVGKTVTRATLSELMIRKEYNHRWSSLSGYQNNPNLGPMTAWNYDLALTWYVDDVSYLSGAIFYKDLQDKWGRDTVTEIIHGVEYQMETPVNMGDGTIKGIELAAQYTFSSLPYPFNGLGVQVNYTDMKEETKDNDLDNESTSYNLVGFYELNGIQARIAYNYRDGYIESLAANRGQPRMVDSYGQWDASLSYDVTEDTTVFLEAINITNEKEFVYSVHTDRLIEYTDTGSRYALGIRHNF